MVDEAGAGVGGTGVSVGEADLAADDAKVEGFEARAVRFFRTTGVVVHGTPFSRQRGHPFGEG